MGNLCLICKKEIEDGENTFTCTECGKVYHAKCWKTTGCCADPECREKTKLRKEAEEKERNVKNNISTEDDSKKEEGSAEKEADVKNNSSTKCVKCGAKLEINQKFCTKCGTDNTIMLRNVCPKCNSVISANMNFCPNCGDSRNVKALTNNKKEFYQKPVFWIIVIIAIIFIIIIIPKDTDTTDMTDNTRIVNEENVQEVVDEILELNIYGIDEIQELYEQGKEYMTVEQKEQCLNQYRKWMAYNYAVDDLRERMKNPKSFEVESGSVDTPFEFNGKLCVRVEITYYGTNSFGGTLRKTSSAFVTFTVESNEEMGNIYIDEILYLPEEE